MAPRFKAPRGTHDAISPDVSRWQHLERTFAELVRLYGYREVRTPLFEETDLFVRSSGETSEVVTKQMYTFTDKGDRSMTLKPEGTAPVVRAYLEHSLGQQGHVTRLWYLTPIYRYERPQKGRYRESHQVGLELIGSGSPAADAEVIEITVRFYERLGITDVRALLNCIGRAETRKRFGEAVLSHVAGWLKDQDSAGQERARKNPLRLLDSKDDEIKEAVVGAPSILDHLEDSSREHFEAVQELLADANVDFSVRPEIVRGLDYYTDTVFEVQSEGLGAQNALCGGGRYDDLVKGIGGPDTPAVGVAMGVERALIVMEDQRVQVPQVRTQAFLVAATDGAKDAVAKLARDMRAAGISVMTDLEERSLRNQMKQADRSLAPHAVILGDEELEAGTVTLRDLQEGTQKQVSQEELIAILVKQG
ncbi:MAG: histidine--tRNA ligase [Armatimonadetes bacterium]|nr:histidine--tRNA ligase [Armatimonadota bacterium]